MAESIRVKLAVGYRDSQTITEKHNKSISGLAGDFATFANSKFHYGKSH